MGYIEAAEAVIYGRRVENVRIPFSRDEYYDLLIIPGFSDGHAHPQVVDAGLEPGVVWRDSYEWIEGRRLRVDEASLRADLGLSSRLAMLTFKRAILEGTTLIAVTGRLEANIRGWLSLSSRPRTVFLPTVMRRRGWATTETIAGIASRYSKYLNDVMARIGVFVHSIRYGGDMIRGALELARDLESVVGIHISEGVREMDLLDEYIGPPPYPSRIVGVHCLEDEDPQAHGIACISCPYSNMLLYRRTRPTINGVSGFGSDWPLLVGTIGGHINVVVDAFNVDPFVVLRKATIGGYLTYGMRHGGDMAAYDGGIEDLLGGGLRPRLVTVGGKPVVVEGRIASTGEDLDEVLRGIREALREAVEAHPLARPVY
ncbi:MAG: hypothetical protein GSR86_03580 [Desulfurococcales archaeon]|nr:hypothetical protein [Desulfurococcales archaeon]